MALSPEMQAQVDQQNAIENNRAANQAASEEKRAKLEALRIAKEVLVENRRTKTAAEAVDIDDAAITNFASVLVQFVNS
jgi:predicted secreted acid phosphatase